MTSYDVVSMIYQALPQGCRRPCPTGGRRGRSDVDERVEGGPAGGRQQGGARRGCAAVDRRLEEVRLSPGLITQRMETVVDVRWEVNRRWWLT